MYSRYYLSIFLGFSIEFRLLFTGWNCSKIILQTAPEVWKPFSVRGMGYGVGYGVGDTVPGEVRPVSRHFAIISHPKLSIDTTLNKFVVNGKTTPSPTKKIIVLTTVVTFTIFVTKETKIETKTKIQTNTIHNGDALTTLKTFPNECIDCVITSPPYYALRDYGIDGQLGLEKTFHEYLDKLIEIFAEVKRVLKPTGTVFVNLGDSYSGAGAAGKNTGKAVYKQSDFRSKTLKTYLQDKSLLNIPSRFAIRMTDELGFIQRNEIIWYKRNCMPSSAKDRFTVDFEKVYFFTKNKKYYFEQVREPSVDSESYTGRRPRKAPKMASYDLKNCQVAGKIRSGFLDDVGKTYPQRNKRCVWDIVTRAYREAHFAVFPEDLVKPMIQAGCPEFVCTKCGFIKQPIMQDTGKRIDVEIYNGTETKDYENHKAQKPSETKRRILESMSKVKEKHYTSCTCNAEFTGGIVLDLFAGSGTTLKVAKDMNRNYIGIELNGNYIPLINKRLGLDKLKLAL